MLAVFVFGAFVYLIQWLEARPDMQTPTAETSPKTEAAPLPTAVNRIEEPPAAAPVAAPGGEQGSTAQPASEDKARVKLAFVGDVMFASKVEDLLVKNGYDYPYKYVKSYLDKADLTIVNLETPITTRGTAQTKEYVYRSSPLALPELKRAGVDLVNLANNHSMDYGQDGLLDTLGHLDDQQLRRVGAGRNAQEAYKHEIIEHKGIKVAFLGFSRVLPDTSWMATAQKPGLAATYSSKLALDAITKARSEADLVVVIAHWGEERNPRPVKVQTDLAHEYIDHGADLIVASHPHVLQGFEQYKGKWIAYSLGNFIFTTNENPDTWESLILEASCAKDRSCDLNLVPILTKWAQPIRMIDDQAQKLFEKLTKNSVNARIDTKGVITVGPVNKFVTETPKPSINKSVTNGLTKSNDGSKPAATSPKPPAKDSSKTGESPKQVDTAKPEKPPKSADTSKTEEPAKPSSSTTNPANTAKQPSKTEKTE